MSIGTSRSGATLISFDLENDVTVRHILDNLPQRGLQAVVRALNRTATFVRADAVREIPRFKRLKPSYIRQSIDIRNARVDRPEAYIFARRRGTQLSRFPFKQVKAAVSSLKTTARAPLAGRRKLRVNQRNAGIQVQIKTDGPAKIMRSAFLINLRGGNKGIAVRLEVLRRLGLTWSPSEEGGSGRRRFAVLHTSSVHDVYSDVLPDIATRVIPFLKTQLLHELEFELDRLRRAA